MWTASTRSPSASGCDCNCLAHVVTVNAAHFDKTAPDDSGFLASTTHTSEDNTMSNFIAADQIDAYRQRLIRMIEKASATTLVNMFEGGGTLSERHDGSTPNWISVRGDTLLVTLAGRKK